MYEVKVVSPGGAPLKDVVVRLAHSGAVVTETRTGQGGAARVCDAPLDASDILVGTDACELVVVKHVTPEWLRTREITVTFTHRPCGDLFVFPKDCRVRMHVVDDKGLPVAGALYQPEPAGPEPVFPASDSLGRFFWEVRSRQVIEGEVIGAGYRPGRVRATCLASENSNLDLRTVLHRP